MKNEFNWSTKVVYTEFVSEVLVKIILAFAACLLLVHMFNSCEREEQSKIKQQTVELNHENQN